MNVIDLKGDRTVQLIVSNTEDHADISACSWATEEYPVCDVDAVDASSPFLLLGFSRLYSISVTEKKTQMLTPMLTVRSEGVHQDGGVVIALDVPGKTNKILMTKSYVPERAINTRLSNEKTGLGVELVDVATIRRSRVEDADPSAIGYLADETGVVRMKVRHPSEVTGYLSERQLYYYRDGESDSWKLLSKISAEEGRWSGFRPRAVDAKRNVAYGFADKDGYQAVFEVPLSETGEMKVLMSRSDVDVDSLIRVGRQRRVVSASYATEKREIAYFDPALAALASKLQQALPGKPLINIIGASADESKLLIVAASDTDPGMVYLYNQTTRELNELLPVRDFLGDQPMGKMQPVNYPAADGTRIPGYLTLPPGSSGKNLPAIVLPHGGPGARDEWGFDWMVQFFVARGYAVLQPNYRGSAGYGEAWFGRNGFQAWKTAIGDVNDAGKWLVTQGIADPGSLAIVGWSYGGYAALQSQVLDPKLFNAVVAIAPVTDLEQLREDSRHYTNFPLVDAMIGRGPFVAEGSPAQHADAFSSPVLLFHGTYDLNVSVNQSRAMERRLKSAGKRVEYVEFEALEHSLTSSQARTAMLKKIDTFLATELKR